MERSVFGVTKDGVTVEKLSFENGDYSFSVLTYGAVLYSFALGGKNIVLHHATLREYEEKPGFYGAVVGPVANRIKAARFTLDGTEYVLERNDGDNNLHSGSACFGKKVWSVLGLGKSSVTLALATPDGLGGFPGAHEATVTYDLTEDGVLTLDYTVTSDKRCPVAVTNHAYFNLNGRESDVMGHKLQIDAPCYVDVDDELIPVAVPSVEGTAFDFLEPHLIGERRDGFYDNSFVLSKCGRLVCEGEAFRLTMRTTEPAVQVYSGARAGVAFESGRYPDTANRPEYPQAFTAPGEPYRTTTSYHLEAR